MRARISLRRAGRVVLAGFAALSLAACGVRAADPITVPGGAPTTMPTTAPSVVPTTAPSVVPTTAPSVVPTTAPTVAPTVGTALPRLVGPEWTIVLNSTLSQNVSEGVVAYKPSATPASNAGPGDFAPVVSELVIVERASNGSPAIRLAVNLDTITADGQVIARLGTATTRPAGLIARGFIGERRIVFSPVNSAGQQYAQDIQVIWDSASQRYRIQGPGGNPQLPPLVGPEWTVIYSGDINSNGMEDVVATKPTNARPSIGGRQHDGFGAFASELVVMERASHGGSNMLVFADLREIRGGGQTLSSFPQVASGLLIYGSVGLLEIHPFSGPALMPGFVKLGLNADGRISVLDGQPPVGQQPVDTIALGPEWVVFDRSDRNRDGIADALAYIPASLPMNGAPGVPEAVASEMGIFQNTAGATQAMASLAQGALYAGGYLVHTFGDGMGTVPAGYRISTQGDGVVITPLDANGAQSGQAVLLSWSASMGAYTATPL